MVFDGDQSDSRAFSEAQYLTRIQGLVEIMAENKRKANKLKAKEKQTENEREIKGKEGGAGRE